MAIRSWQRVAHRWVFNTLRCKSAKNDSMAGVVSGGADVAHRSDHPKPGQGSMDFPSSKLAAPVGVKYAAGHVASSCGGHLECCDHDPGFHSFIDGPSDDPVRPEVLDGANVELGLRRSDARSSRRPTPGLGRQRRTGGEPDRRGRRWLSWLLCGSIGVCRNCTTRRFSEQIRHTVRSPTSWPVARTSSAKNR